jgi:hypothetical protein
MDLTLVPFFVQINTAPMLHRELNHKESLVSAVKQHYAATKILRSKDGNFWIGSDPGGSNRNHLGLWKRIIISSL